MFFLLTWKQCLVFGQNHVAGKFRLNQYSVLTDVEECHNISDTVKPV
jgi:hypothetical protein